MAKTRRHDPECAGPSAGQGEIISSSLSIFFDEKETSMADIIRIKDRRDAARHAHTPSTGSGKGSKAEILFFTGIRHERLDTQAIWPRVELPTVPALPAPQGSDRCPF
jgi:hypothetical protein